MVLFACNDFSYMQSMASELNMYESQVSEYRMDLDRLQREMQEVKKKYFLQKKKEHALRYKTDKLQMHDTALSHSLVQQRKGSTEPGSSYDPSKQGRPSKVCWWWIQPQTISEGYSINTPSLRTINLAMHI